MAVSSGAVRFVIAFLIAPGSGAKESVRGWSNASSKAIPASRFERAEYGAHCARYEQGAVTIIASRPDMRAMVIGPLLVFNGAGSSRSVETFLHPWSVLGYVSQLRTGTTRRCRSSR